MNHARTGGEPVRASDAERDQVAEILRAGYAEGRLTRDELEERLTAVYAAKTRADLRDLTGDLPVAGTAPTAAGPPTIAGLPLMDDGSGTGQGPDRCLLLCLLIAVPPAGIVYWILTARRKQLAAREREWLPTGPGDGRLHLPGDPSR